MQGHAWPGNVRELDHAVERGVLMATGKVVRTADLGLNAGSAAPRIEDMSLEEVEAISSGKPSHVAMATPATPPKNSASAAAPLPAAGKIRIMIFLPPKDAKGTKWDHELPDVRLRVV